MARAFPTYRKKTNLPGPTGNSVAQSSKVEEKVIGVEFFIVGSENRSLSNEECEMLHVAADCVRTTARIVDMPPNDMHTDAFLEVNARSILSNQGDNRLPLLYFRK